MFIAEGLKTIEEALRSGAGVRKVFALEEVAASFGTTCPVEVVSQREMASISALSSASGALALVQIQKEEKPDFLALSRTKVLLLDDLSDPGNLGTVLRTADWFGFRDVIVSENTVDQYNPKVIQSTMGSIFRVRVYRHSLVDALVSLKKCNADFRVFAAVMDGRDIRCMNNNNIGALLIGSESHGPGDAVLTECTDPITIAGVEGAESLNAAIAAGILMHAWAGLSPRN